jgi:uncharacterized protein (TIGR00661 family)
LASIVYAMCGEGRGHATRARAVVEALCARHELTLFASECAFEMLSGHFSRTRADVRLVQIPGLQFGYSSPGRVDLFRTLGLAAHFRWAVNDYVEQTLPELERARPDLVIADFEPIVPRAARRLGVPFVSFDHQHFLVVSDLSALPFSVRQQANLSAPFVRALYDWQRATIVSSFYRAPLKPAHRDTTWVGTLIRSELLPIQPTHGRYLVAYMRRHAAPETLAALAASGREVRVYGLGARPSEGTLRFCAIDERRFIEDLAGCDAVVSTAGNQLVGEALFLRKPLLVMPEAWNFEQSVNAYFLEQSGAGWAERGSLTPARLGAFLEATATLRAKIRPDAVCGNEAAVAALERHLGQPPAKLRPPRMAPRQRVAAEQWA